MIPLPPVPFPRSSFVMPVSDFLVMTDSKARSRTICGFTSLSLTGERCGGSHLNGRKPGAVTVADHPAGGVTGQPDASALRPACLSRPRGGAQGPSSGSTKRPFRSTAENFYSAGTGDIQGLKSPGRHPDNAASQMIMPRGRVHGGSDRPLVRPVPHNGDADRAQGKPGHPRGT